MKKFDFFRLSSQLVASSSAENTNQMEKNETQARIIKIQTELDTAHQKLVLVKDSIVVFSSDDDRRSTPFFGYDKLEI